MQNCKVLLVYGCILLDLNKAHVNKKAIYKIVFQKGTFGVRLGQHLGRIAVENTAATEIFFRKREDQPLSHLKLNLCHKPMCVF